MVDFYLFKCGMAVSTPWCGVKYGSCACRLLIRKFVAGMDMVEMNQTMA